ncbi:MAG: chitinase [Micromonosporaceae bacterium]
MSRKLVSRKLWWSGGVAAVGLAAAIAVAVPAQAANLLTNGGFETGSLAGWSCSGTVVNSPVHSGVHSFAGTVTSSTNGRCAQTVTVRPSTAYTLSAWVRGSYVYLGVTGGGSTWTPSATDWTKLTTSFTTGASQTSAEVYLHGWYAQGTYHADDVSLDGPGGPSPSPTASPTTSPTPSPTMSPSPSPTTSPTGPPPSDLPKHTLTGYWHNFLNGSVALRLRDVSPRYDLVAVAFAEADPARPGAVGFTVDPDLSSALGGYSDADVASDVSALHARGAKVVISVGGERGNVPVNDATSAANFADSVYALMTRFDFDGVDIDLEHGLSVEHMTSALRQLSTKAGSRLVLTMAPQTIDMQSTAGSYFRLALNVKDILTVVHTQYYNSGTMLGCDGKVYAQGTVEFLTALACIALENGLRPDQVALGLPASSRAAGGGYVNPAVVNNALDCLARGTNCGSHRPPRTYPEIRGAMTWSVNWDRVAGDSFSNTVGPHLDTLP